MADQAFLQRYQASGPSAYRAISIIESAYEPPIAKSDTYRLLRRRRMEGEAALEDRRHGHPYVLRAPMRHWLQAYCRAYPAQSGRLIQVALWEQCGLAVSVSQINRVRSTLGLSRRTHRAMRMPIKPAQAASEGNRR